MSDRKLKKRDRIRGLFPRRPQSPFGKTGLGETSTSAPSASAVNETAPSTVTPTSSMQHLLTPAEPPLKPQPGLGSAIGDATFKPNPTSQPGPTPAAVAAMGTARTQVPAGNEGEPVPTAADSIQAESLWSRAINGLSPKERETLIGTGPGVDSRETVSAVRSMVEAKLNKEKGELWKVKFRGEEIVLRDIGTKILRWVDKFKQIGDIIVQYDPVHAALPWAGFRFLLQVDMIH